MPRFAVILPAAGRSAALPVDAKKVFADLDRPTRLAALGRIVPTRDPTYASASS